MVDGMMCEILSNLGILYSNQNDLDKAEECGLEALEIGRCNFDLLTDVRGRVNMDLQLRGSLRTLAIVYRKQSRFEEAERLFGEAYNIASKNFTDMDCPEAIAAAVEQTECILESGDIDKALRFAEHLCDGSYRSFRDPDSIAKAERTFLLGKVYNANKQYEYAERVLRATLVWYERVYGVNDTRTGRCVSELGIALLRQDKLGDETRAVLQRSFDIRLLNLGPDAENVGIANENLGRFHYKIGEYVQTKRFWKETLRIYTKVLGPEHPKTVELKEIFRLVQSER